MTNGEKYRDEILKEYGEDSLFCEHFIKPKVLKRGDCVGIGCAQCRSITALWLNEEYKEPEVDWSKVEVDTPIFVSDFESEKSFIPEYFAKYEDGKVYAWGDGRTSFSSTYKDTICWKYAKLAEVE